MGRYKRISDWWAFAEAGLRRPNFHPSSEAPIGRHFVIFGSQFETVTVNTQWHM